ncbi:MAG: ATP-binding protein [Lachnospiraceae bacterium]|nr:ATP-binding protein [Lachnospiraceae bacterium]
MFIGRKSELALLEKMYQKEGFQFLVLYGRRRVGKTSLLCEFAKKYKSIFFSAQEKNDALNLEDFSKTVQKHFSENYFGTFSDWQTAFQYLGDRASGERLILIIDEFPFIAGENPSIKSILQHTIDHNFKEKNIFLILCGSSVSFMENEIMGYKSPLYGRSTGQLEVLPFDYYDSSLFFEKYSNIDKLLAYGILGGVPCYLNAFSDKISIKKNIAEQIIRTGAFLKDEPQLLLKMELRELSVYNSIFEAIADGASRLNDISLKIHEESQKCSKYINTLRSIKLIERITPSGDDESSKKSLYKIADNYFSFWYKFIFSNMSYYELLDANEAAEEIAGELPDYMGNIFENICLQYMLRLAKNKKLPFVPYSIGRWWGANPITKKQDDIDILALNKNGDAAIFCECKFRNSAFDMKEYDDLICASNIFTKPEKRYYYLFSKGGYTKAVCERAKEDGTVLVSIDDLFDDNVI